MAKIKFNPPLTPDNNRYGVDDLISDMEFLGVIFEFIAPHLSEEQIFKLQAEFLIMRKTMQDIKLID